MTGPLADDTTELLSLASGADRRALARLISRAERGERLPPIPLQAADDGQRLCVGITGAPGAGKSTLVSALVDECLKTRDRVAVLAVDPSSPVSRGALLGDRVRMHRHAATPEVFIRSMASRSAQGGLAAATQTARRLLQHCGWPLVLIETVGVGQVELDVVDTADIAVVVLNPGWGDEIQANKAGLMEIADIFVINKADRPGVESTRRDIEAVIGNRPPRQRPPVLETVASEGRGIAELAAAIMQTQQRLLDAGALTERRNEQLRAELAQRLRRRVGGLVDVLVEGDGLDPLLGALKSGDSDMDASVDALLLDLVAVARREADRHR